MDSALDTFQLRIEERRWPEEVERANWFKDPSKGSINRASRPRTDRRRDLGLGRLDSEATQWTLSKDADRSSRRHQWSVFVFHHLKAEVGRALLAPLETTIEASRRLLDLKDNWDGDGAKGYSQDTWIRATSFLREGLRWRLFDLEGHAWLCTPTIAAGPEGSIDVHWKVDHGELLLNIPADAQSLATYYGDKKLSDGRVVYIKGAFLSSDPQQEFWLWLAKHR